VLSASREEVAEGAAQYSLSRLAVAAPELTRWTSGGLDSHGLRLEVVDRPASLSSNH
jgi:hypothetical protein